MTTCFSCFVKSSIRQTATDGIWHERFFFFLIREHKQHRLMTATNKKEFPCSPLIYFFYDNTLLCSDAIYQHLQVTNPCERTNDHSEQ